ncbi:hypothetical protein [Parasitella parasitica]|uniref:VHS domain-containing protein n=1 Tax=Parasitella parasitica TaxID=35722 RepID=A0A0B7NIZ0_9FUNG|nr:hypothetical protein [Parasitella parasitica]
MAKIVFEEDAEIIIPESAKKQQDNDIFDQNSSEDEAPETISTSKARESLKSKAHAEKEASDKLIAAAKEKRRQREQFLKEQKEGSKRQLKEMERKARKEKLEKEYKEKMEKRKQREQEKLENGDEDEENEGVELLPSDLLQQALLEEQEDEANKRKHVTTEEFERIIAEQEAEERERAKKRKTTKEGRTVGEYTVKVLNNRPKLQKSNKNILNMRKVHMNRHSVPRKEAVVNISSGRDGAALVFRHNLSNYDQIEWFQFQQLIESISMQSSGAKEAIDAIRKKLKHGTPEQKLRALEILRLLMENSNQRFYRELVHHDKMKERFDLIIESSTEDLRVRKLLVTLLGIWAIRFKNERGMRVLQELYDKGKLYLEPRKPIPFVGLLKKSFSSYKVDAPVKPNAMPTSKSSLAILSTAQTNTVSFNFEKSKPKIIQQIAMATQSGHNLINALQHGNLDDKIIQESYLRCEQDCKKIVYYIRLVENEEWIGTLLAANEVLLKALDMHDAMLTTNSNKGEGEGGMEDPFADPR